jgi:hypothetical protein
MACEGTRNWGGGLVGNRRRSRECGTHPGVGKGGLFSCLLTDEHHRLRGESRYARDDVLSSNYPPGNHPPIARQRRSATTTPKQTWMAAGKRTQERGELLPAVLILIMQESAMKPGEFRKNPSFLRELVMFIKHNKKWYLIPVAVSLLLLGVLIVLGSTGAAPFIYTLF